MEHYSQGKRLEQRNKEVSEVYFVTEQIALVVFVLQYMPL
jgi:hypothetical protein